MYVHYELVQHRGERDNAFSGFNFANFELEIRVETLQRITKLFKRFFFLLGGVILVAVWLEFQTIIWPMST